MLVAPLALLVMIFGYKKNKTKFDQFVILLVITVSLGLTIIPCNSVYAVSNTLSIAEPTMAPSAISYTYAITVSKSMRSISAYIVKSPGLSDCNQLLGRKRYLRSTEYDPTIDPNTYIEGFPGWGPTKDIDLSPSVPINEGNAQYKPYLSGGEFIGSNLCGQIALSMIASTYYGGVDLLPKILENLPASMGKTNSKQLLEAAMKSFPKYIYWDGSAYYFDNEYKMNTSMTSLPLPTTYKPWSATITYPEIVANPSLRYDYGEIADQELLNKLSNHANLLIMANLKISGEDGVLVPYDSSTGHWVVLTGMSSNWYDFDEGSEYHWVRINNPFNNRTEYYQWSDFKSSISSGEAAYHLVELYDRFDFRTILKTFPFPTYY